MYEKVYTSTKVVTLQSGDNLQYFQYNINWDAVAARSSRSWWRIFRDGSAPFYGQPSGQYYQIALDGGRLGFCSTFDTYGYVADPITATPGLEVINPDFAWAPIGDFMHTGSVLVDMKNQLLVRIYRNSIVIRYLKTGTILHTVATAHNANSDSIAWVEEGILCFMEKATGKVFFFDYLCKREITETGTIDPFRFATFDCLNQVFIVLRSDYKIDVYVRNSYPDTLGNPAFVDPTTGVGVSLVKARLTGSSGEPCVGWWVHWLLESSGGFGPFGSLLVDKSLTDEDGYAWNTYIGPDDGSTGATKISCRVLVP